MDFNFFEEFCKSCGYDYSKENNSNNTPPGVADEECRNSNSDIPNGFQDVSPQLFILIGEVLGNCLAGNLPFNVQNALGNWLQLVGQAILTANAQQQYFQSGPGRYYNPIYRNSTNPFCPTSDTSSSTSSSKSTSDKKNTDLERRIIALEKEIELLKKDKSNK